MVSQLQFSGESGGRSQNEQSFKSFKKIFQTSSVFISFFSTDSCGFFLKFIFNGVKFSAVNSPFFYYTFPLRSNFMVYLTHEQVNTVRKMFFLTYKVL